MFTDCCQKFVCLGYQLLTFNHFVFQLLAILEVTGVFLLPLLVIVNGFNRQVGDEEVDIGLNLVQFPFQVQNVKGWIKEVILLGHGLQELNSKAYVGGFVLVHIYSF